MLTLVVQTQQKLRTLTSTPERRQQDGNEQRDNRDHNQKFNQCKRRAGSCTNHVTPLLFLSAMRWKNSNVGERLTPARTPAT
ncbi:MAG: hypothetical protein ACIARQ_10270 [Phycisphaerales bacterium JB061]